MTSLIIEFHHWEGFGIATEQNCRVFVAGFLTVVVVPFSVMTRLSNITTALR